jgi:hypothetical protein
VVFRRGGHPSRNHQPARLLGSERPPRGKLVLPIPPTAAARQYGTRPSPAFGEKARVNERRRPELALSELWPIQQYGHRARWNGEVRFLPLGDADPAESRARRRDRRTDGSALAPNGLNRALRPVPGLEVPGWRHNSFNSKGGPLLARIVQSRSGRFELPPVKPAHRTATDPFRGRLAVRSPKKADAPRRPANSVSILRSFA